MKKFFKEFKEFALKGRVVDLAVAVVIGGAFGAIVTSFINDILMPLLGLIFKVDFSNWGIVLGENPEGLTPFAAAEAGISVFYYGKFISAIVYFLLIALAIFIVVRALNKAEEKIASLKKKEEEAPAPAPRLCPFCRMEIAEDATRCPHCTSLIEDKEVL